MDDDRRETLAALIKDISAVKNLLDDAPHRVAREAIRLLDGVVSVLGEEFPGHEYYGRCISCEEPKGVDEMHSAGDEDVCGDCLKALVEDQKTTATT